MSSVLAAVVAWSGAAVAGCDSSETTNEDVVVALEKAMVSYGDLDIPAFRESVGELVSLVECLEESIARPTAAEFHRVQGLAAFLDHDEQLCRQRFAAARAIEPDYDFPVNIVPDGNPVLRYYRVLDPNQGAKTTLPYPAEGSIRLDGTPRLERHPDLPVIFQRMDEGGAVVETLVLGPGVSPPTYEVGKAPRPVSANRTLKRALLVAGGGALLAAGGVYGAAYGSRNSFKKNNTELSPTELQRAIKRNHTLVYTSAAVGVVGLGLGGGALVLSGSF